MGTPIEDLASYQRIYERLRTTWPVFLKKRQLRLEQQARHGTAAEKVAENIIEDLFTEVLDWSLGDLNNQIDYADILLSSNGYKYLLIETKRPGSLAWNRRAVDAALDQAVRYANNQMVNRVAVSDGYMLYAADIEHGGLQDRIFVSLQSEHPPEDLWWLSVHGIYRPCERSDGAKPEILPKVPDDGPSAAPVISNQLLHPKYKVPARCFAYVGNADNPSTWKLPYLILDGSPDVRRLPKAIQSILSNYRGVKVSAVPESAIPDVLVRLAHAATRLGKMPGQTGKPAAAYVQLTEALRQFGKLDDLLG